MEVERWLDQRIEVLKTQVQLGPHAVANLPLKLRKQMASIDPNETNRFS